MHRLLPITGWDQPQLYLGPATGAGAWAAAATRCSTPSPHPALSDTLNPAMLYFMQYCLIISEHSKIYSDHRDRHIYIVVLLIVGQVVA